MGTPGNGDSRPDREGLPDLPAEWGTIVVPDDASALDAEAAQVRRELRRRRRVVRPGAGPVDGHPGRFEPASLRIPLLIVSLAVLAALTSLIAVIWQGQRQSDDTPGTSGGGAVPAATLPALDLTGPDGARVPVRGLLPAVLVLVKDCACDAQIQAVAAGAPAQVTVVPVGGRPAPTGAPGPGTAPIRPLGDPDARLDAFVDGLVPGQPGPTVLLVAASGRIVRTLPATTPVEAYREDLALLPSR
ncbi:hypothetical protein AB0M79_11325 [Polymorphospora sp. NPDC051019]|uniref:hypothetical protein n=1 Tax=Polymorphospora sp. NPDC051019 TaxID=3155725 RepID=UPI00341D5CD9